MSSNTGVTDVYLHIGLPKTGTSYLQEVLWQSREQLSTAGVLVPGTNRHAQRMAVWDLMGRRLRGVDQPEVAGSWQALVQAVSNWSGSSVVISEEFLTNARPGQARKAVSALSPARVHVVVTARDLAQVVGSAWQQQLGKGRTWTWEEFIAAVRDPQHGPATAGVAFWLHQDLVRVLDTWGAAVPHSRVHVVTVPPPGQPRHLLLERFAAATGLDTARLVAEVPAANESVGAVEAEVSRRLNVGLGGRLNEQQYAAAVQRAVRPALRDRKSSQRIRVPASELEWLTPRATELVRAVRSGGYQVHGDLEDLIPSADAAGDRRPDDVDDDELAEATMTALVAVTEKYGQLWSRTRRRDTPAETASAHRLASQARAYSFRAQLAVLALADRHRWVNKAVGAYLRRSAGRS